MNVTFIFYLPKSLRQTKYRYGLQRSPSYSLGCNLEILAYIIKGHEKIKINNNFNLKFCFGSIMFVLPQKHYCPCISLCIKCLSVAHNIYSMFAISYGFRVKPPYQWKARWQMTSSLRAWDGLSYHCSAVRFAEAAARLRCILV